MVFGAGRLLLIRTLLALMASLLALNYLLSPAHIFRPDSLIHFIIPQHGAFSYGILVETWLDRGVAIFVWAMLNTTILAAGLCMKRLLRVRAGLLLAYLLGLAPTSLLILGLGLCGLLIKPAILLAGAGLLAMFRKIQRPGGRPAAFWLGLAPSLLAIPAVLSPETVFDSLRYHQGLPKLFLTEHRIFHVPRFLFSGFPANMGMLYAVGQAFASPVTAKLLNWQFIPFSAALLWGALRTVLSPALCGLVCAGFSIMPFLAFLSISANADCALMGLLFAATLCVLLALREDRSSHFRTAGWLLGTAIGVKYLGAFAAIVIFASLTLARPRKLASFTRQAWPMLLILPAAWAAKNWLFAGNPCFPYMQSLFGAFDVEPETLARHLSYAADWRREYPLLSAWLRLLPVSLTSGVYLDHAEAFSPLLFFLPAAFAASREKPSHAVRFLAVFCLAFYFLWSHLGGGIYRFLVPFFPAGTLLCALLLPGLNVYRPALAAGLAVNILLQAPLTLSSQYYSANAAELFFGRESQSHYLRRILPPQGRHTPALARASLSAGAGNGPARLLLAGEIQAFYSPGRTLLDFEFAPPLLNMLAQESGTPARLRIRLKQRGVTAILYRVEGMISIQAMSAIALPPGPAGRLQEFWRRYAEPAWIEEYPAENCYYHCYRLRDLPADFAAPGGVLWFNLPGMEHLTREIDRLLEAGEPGKAADAADNLARARPELAAAWLRVALACRASGDEAGLKRARASLERLGYAALLE